jgi:hypothetical protein
LPRLIFGGGTGENVVSADTCNYGDGAANLSVDGDSPGGAEDGGLAPHLSADFVIDITFIAWISLPRGLMNRKEGENRHAHQKTPYKHS